MMSTRRKLAISTWDAPREGNIYGKLTVDAGPGMA
jgi:pyruvate dehydrogenase E2 component (dihydrolipoamide acetyltransferase)